MKLRWPRSLASRMIVLVLLAVLAVQAVTVAIFLSDRADFLAGFTKELLTKRLPTVVSSLEKLSPQDRQVVVPAMESHSARYALSEAPQARNGTPEPGLVQQITQALSVSSDRVRVVSVAPGKAVLYAKEAARGNLSSVLQVSVRLDNGSWLNLERPSFQAGWHVTSRFLLVGLLYVLSLTAAVAVTARWLARPLRLMADTADRLGRGESVPPLPERGPDEIARTLRAFNLMGERLRRFLLDRTRMLAAISHDLRTPITALRIRTEMLDDEPIKERLVRSLDEMEAMVEATLQFARTEGKQEATRAVNLDELLRDVAGEVDPAGSRIVVKEPADGFGQYRCRPVALRRAVRNLLENAVRYGGAATLSVHKEGHWLILRIVDEGPGVDPETVEALFEPFVRAEASRSADTGGVGLGLAIARSIVRGHGGDVTLGNAEGGGTVATVTLPAAGLVEGVEIE